MCHCIYFLLCIFGILFWHWYINWYTLIIRCICSYNCNLYTHSRSTPKSSMIEWCIFQLQKYFVWITPFITVSHIALSKIFIYAKNRFLVILLIVYLAPSKTILPFKLALKRLRHDGATYHISDIMEVLLMGHYPNQQ